MEDAKAIAAERGRKMKGVFETGGVRKYAYGRDNERGGYRDILGTLGEMAVWKWAQAQGLDWEWHHAKVRSHFDVGRVGVRTRWKSDWDLLIYDRDDAQDKMILVVMESESDDEVVLRVCGWMEVGEARCHREEWTRNFGSNFDRGRWPVIAVPQSALHPMLELVRGNSETMS